jgi:Rod binding domain-containing protein
VVSAVTLLGTDAVRTAADDRLRDAADRLVGTVFYGTLLRQMRDSKLKGKYGHGGRGEEIFQAQLDQRFAEQAGQASSNALADAIYREFRTQAQAVERFRLDQETRLQELQRQLRDQQTLTSETPA